MGCLRTLSCSSSVFSPVTTSVLIGERIPPSFPFAFSRSSAFAFAFTFALAVSSFGRAFAIRPLYRFIVVSLSLTFRVFVGGGVFVGVVIVDFNKCEVCTILLAVLHSLFAFFGCFNQSIGAEIALSLSPRTAHNRKASLEAPSSNGSVVRIIVSGYISSIGPHRMICTRGRDLFAVVI